MIQDASRKLSLNGKCLAAYLNLETRSACSSMTPALSLAVRDRHRRGAGTVLAGLRERWPHFKATLEQGCTYLRAFADQHQCLGVLEPLGECIGILHVVIPDRDLVVGEFGEACERAQGIVVVVEDGDIQDDAPGHRSARNSASQTIGTYCLATNHWPE
jgi:hypothetical protein